MLEISEHFSFLGTNFYCSRNTYLEILFIYLMSDRKVSWLHHFEYFNKKYIKLWWHSVNYLWIKLHSNTTHSFLLFRNTNAQLLTLLSRYYITSFAMLNMWAKQHLYDLDLIIIFCTVWLKHIIFKTCQSFVILCFMSCIFSVYIRTM